MKNKQIASWMLLSSCFTLNTSHAETLSCLLELATNNEPTYLSAMSTVQAANARKDQALDGLLPKVDISANTNYNIRDFNFSMPCMSNNEWIIFEPPEYNSRGLRHFVFKNNS